MSDVSDIKLKQIWEEALLDIKDAVGEGSFKTWISKLDIIGIDDIVLKLAAPSNFIRDNVLSRFADKIIQIMNSYGCQIRAISIDVYDKTTASISEDNTEANKINTREYQDISILDKRFTFKNFVVGKPNEFAYAAAIRVSESETPAFNPLFLYGGVGLGKTHLMHAIAWNTNHHFPKKKVIYLSAEKFMYLFIKSLRFKNAISFKEMFRTVDVLMIDDVQFIGGKDTTQEEFFHTFNELVDNNKQIILSADKSPSDLGGVEDRLKSRLGWGLVADIHPTTYELRLGILQAKSKQYKAEVPDNVLEFLAAKITSNIRELEGSLNRIVAHSTLVGRCITLDVAHEVLRDILRANEKVITIDIIQKKVCEYYGVKFSDLISARRHKAVTMARQIAMYLCKILTTKSLPDIGKSFGGKDHSTVIHAVKKVKDLITRDQSFSADLEILTKSLQN
ncbi:MAG: chromosomal replication initiator protein DnaA [Holosporales bacterium]|jgi:chromosomal replication initiator protein|nr:chromosomal replication initiator protein DnaA [Holosporales bacterium]